MGEYVMVLWSFFDWMECAGKSIALGFVGFKPDGVQTCDWGFVGFGFHVEDMLLADHHLILTLAMDGRYLLIITSCVRGECRGGGV